MELLPSPVVGSSQNNKAGSVSSSVANDKRFFSPPDNALDLFISPIRVSLQLSKPTFSRIDRINLFFSDLLIRRSSLR